MAKIKNKSGNWLSTLQKLNTVIQEEYKDGGKLPPVSEMAKRFGVSINTYWKALRSICLHGLAKASTGRAGTVVLPENLRKTKIGYMIHSPAAVLNLPLMAELQKQITRQKASFILQTCVYKNADSFQQQVLILNLKAVIAVAPQESQLPVLQKMHRNGIPVAAIEFYTYDMIEKAMKLGLPYFHVAPEAIAQGVVAYADKIKAKKFLQIDRLPTILTRKFEEAFRASGRVFQNTSFLPFAQIEKGLCARIRNCSIDLIYAKCNYMDALRIMNTMRKMPASLRPVILFSAEVKRQIILDKSADGIRIGGYFDLETIPFETGCKAILDALTNHKPITECAVHDFKITAP